MMNQNVPKAHFSDFLERFPTVDLPITLSDESHHDFSKHNDPLSMLLVAQFIAPIEPKEIDELTEYIACFRIPDTHDFHAIVYWKAALMDYTYVLVTFSKQGELIDKRVIGGTYSDGQSVTKSVATIDEDWLIYVISGKSDNTDLYDANTSKAFDLEILPDGRIINAL